MTASAQQQIGGGPVPPLVMPSLRVVGVDPGVSGALALMVGGKLIKIVDMPCRMVERNDRPRRDVDGYALGTVLRAMDPHVLIIEQVWGFTGQAASEAFMFGRAAGAVEYGAEILGLFVARVTPTRWKRALGLATAKKSLSRALAQKLFPDHAECFALAMHDGRAEAALIAEWFTRTNGPTARPEHLEMTIRK